MTLEKAIERCHVSLPGISFEFVPVMNDHFLQVRATTTDSTTGEPRTIIHTFSVPAGHTDWSAFLCECCMQVAKHEVMENFWEDDERPFFPNHHPGGPDTYVIRRISKTAAG